MNTTASPALDRSASVAGRSLWDFSDRRRRAFLLVVFSLLTFSALFMSGSLIGEAGMKTNFMEKNLPPSLEHPFGTDPLGRDMLARTIKGLCRSLWVGMSAASVSTVFALALGLSAATLGRKTDAAIMGAVDVVISMPHLVLLILISFAMGGGARGVIVAVALTHWVRLSRIIRAEALQLKTSHYVQLAAKLGRSRAWIAWHHMLPHLFPQFVVGLILLFPHAILHAAGLTFLGFGLSPHLPSVGVLLSEAMRYLSTGAWWLAAAPGASLVLMVKLFDVLGGSLRYLLDPRTSQD
ncbi:MAG: ABC transporter permease [Pseudomonadota bacterium]